MVESSVEDVQRERVGHKYTQTSFVFRPAEKMVLQYNSNSIYIYIYVHILVYTYMCVTSLVARVVGWG